MNTINIDNNKIEKSIAKNANGEIIIDCDTNIYINKTISELNFHIVNNSRLCMYIKNSSMIFNYDIKSTLELNIFTIDTKITSTLELNKENISLDYFYSTINTKDNDYKVDINHNYKNTNSKVINNGLNLTNKKLSFIINGHIKKQSTNVKCNQDSYIIVMDENNSIIEPNLIIDNNDIDANHSAYIGHFKQNSLFYLKSRGINQDNALKLLSKAFLIGNRNIPLKNKEKIIKDLNVYWR